jgi:hypothetical protein
VYNTVNLGYWVFCFIYMYANTMLTPPYYPTISVTSNQKCFITSLWISSGLSCKDKYFKLFSHKTPTA